MLTPPEGGHEFLVLGLRGAQPQFDIAAFASELARFSADRVGVRMMLDWSSIERWAFKPPSAAAIHDWDCATPRLQRAAIVHSHKWHRQAAVLSALMRVSHVEVRSFHPIQRELAVAWLQRDP